MVLSASSTRSIGSSRVLPGAIAFVALLCGLPVAPTLGPRPANGQVAVEDLEQGQSIRFRLEEWRFEPGRLLRGRFEESTASGLRYTAVPSGQSGFLPYDELIRLDVLRGRRRLMIEGAAIGGLGGCVVGRGTGDGAAGCAVGAAIGGVALGLAGRLLRIDQWRGVALPGGG